MELRLPCTQCLLGCAFACFLMVVSLEGARGDLADGISLMNIKEMVGNPDVLNGWVADKDPCLPPIWLGVACNNAGRVKELSLNKLGLKGRLSPMIGGLTDLEKLSLQGNQFTGYVPDNLSLTKVKSLDVSDNMFYGPLDTLVANLPNLEFFYGQNNYFAGYLPTTFNQVQKLIVLNLNNNNYHGRVPDNLAELPNLVFLLLEANLLGGSIPGSLANMTSLRFLNLANNSFTGQIPDDFASTQNLVTFDVSFNQLTGAVPVRLLEKPGFKYAGNAGLTVYDQPAAADQALPAQAVPNAVSAPSSGSSSSGITAGAVFGITLAALAGIALLAGAGFLAARHVWGNSPYFPGLAGLAAGRWQPRWKTYRRVNSPQLPMWRAGGVRTFAYEELCQATHEFTQECEQNVGDTRTVFLGTLNTGEFVAVERLPGSAAEKDFISAAEALGRLSHPHLVKVLGYCCQKHVQLMVMEHPTSGSLKDHLGGSLGDRPPLSWHQRLESAVGIGSALHYLHNEGQVHGSLKSSAVFMDVFLNAKLSVPAVRLKDDIPVPSNDVYKFGLLLLELFTGSPDNNRLAARWASPDVDLSVVEAHMDGRVASSGAPLESLQKLLRAALSCLAPAQSDRAEISVILDDLRQALALHNKATGGPLPSPPTKSPPASPPSKDLISWTSSKERSSSDDGEVVSQAAEKLRSEQQEGLGLGVLSPNQSAFNSPPVWSQSGLGLGSMALPLPEAKGTKPAWMLE